VGKEHLFEDEIIDEEKARELFVITEDQILKQSSLTGRAKRWQRVDRDISFGSLNENMERVSRLDAVDEEQIKQDSARIKEIMDMISGNS